MSQNGPKSKFYQTLVFIYTIEFSFPLYLNIFFIIRCQEKMFQNDPKVEFCLRVSSSLF